MAGVPAKQRAEAARRRRELEQAETVHQLRLEGLGYPQIAHRLKMTARETALLHAGHIDRLRELEALGAAEAARKVQDERYEVLLSSVWARALSGELEAVRECRQILDSITNREAKVTAMISGRDDTGHAVTLIAEGATEDYIKALRGL